MTYFPSDSHFFIPHSSAQVTPAHQLPIASFSSARNKFQFLYSVIEFPIIEVSRPDIPYLYYRARHRYFFPPDSTIYLYTEQIHQDNDYS